jgi:hypothetical protein
MCRAPEMVVPMDLPQSHDPLSCWLTIALRFGFRQVPNRENLVVLARLQAAPAPCDMFGARPHLSEMNAVPEPGSRNGDEFGAF